MKKAKHKFFNLKFLNKLKNKIFSMTVSKIVITFASVLTVTHVGAADLSAPSLVPQRPISPQLPTQTTCQIIKVNQLNSMK